VPNLLTINGGSSSIRFAIFAPERPPRLLLQGKIDRIGTAEEVLDVILEFPHLTPLTLVR